MPDNDSEMISQMGTNLIDLQVKFRLSSIDDRAVMRPQLIEAMQDFAAYQTKLLKEGVITSEADLADMQKIRAEIDAAGDRQAMLMAIARVIGFIAVRI